MISFSGLHRISLISGINVDFISLNMEFDCFQSYFFHDFDTEEDFYKSTAPSEDIWKKFELLPTPPMSPHRTLCDSALHFSPGDKLNWLTKVLGPDEVCEGAFTPDPAELFDNLSAHIIQDCMWSSSEKVSAAAAQTPAPQQISVRATKTQCASTGGLISAAIDCVDPAAVLTFPASSCRKPASSGSESRSDSSGKNSPTLPCLWLILCPPTMGFLEKARRHRGKVVVQINLK